MRVVLPFAALLLSACTCGPEPAPAHATNLVVVVIDTLRADHLQPDGYATPTSASLAAFAEQSVVFDRAYSHSPWTKPAMATLLASLAPRDHGIAEWEQPLEDEPLTLTGHLAVDRNHGRPLVSTGCGVSGPVPRIVLSQQGSGRERFSS